MKKFRYSKAAIFLLMSVLVVLGVFEFFQIYKEERSLTSELSEIREKNLKLEEENRRISSDIEYFGIPENLEKELRSKFNYKAIGEELVIIPEPATATAGTR